MSIWIRTVAALAVFTASCRTFEFIGDFSVEGRPVNPACVRALAGPLEVRVPLVVAVDLAAWDASDVRVIERNGAFRIEGDQGFFEYRYLGSTPAGTHVLVTAENTGGSGVFEDVLLMRFDEDFVLEDGQPRRRRLLRRVGAFTLGDRDDGLVELRGNQLVLGASRYRSKECAFYLD